MTIDALKQLLGSGNYIDDPEKMTAYLTPWRGRAAGSAGLIALPQDVQQVAQIVKHCAESNISIVPQAGNTGLVDGSWVDSSEAVIINTSRMRAIRSTSAANNSMVVEAGVTLNEIHEAAEKVGRFFPLSMASEGTAQLGGMVATNPGGTAVLKYGNFRDLLLGLEIVLPSGEIWSDLRPLRKNNAGYDLKHLFIGSEGTLGVVTAATLSLFSKPKQVVTALLAIDSLATGLDCLTTLQEQFGDSLTAFETFSDICVGAVQQHLSDVQFPFDEHYPHYLLIECSTAFDDFALKDAFEHALADLWEKGGVTNAVIAESGQQAENLWALRENISESARHLGTGIHFDIAVPVQHIATFVEQANAAITEQLPNVTTVAFGHMGDGNIHYNQYIKGAVTSEDAAKIRAQLETIIYTKCMELDGTVSAEHGIGLDRQEAFYQRSDPVFIALMEKIKHALDPAGIMNPGKVIKA